MTINGCSNNRAYGTMFCKLKPDWPIQMKTNQVYICIKLCVYP